MVQIKQVIYVDTLSKMLEEGMRIIEEGAIKVNLKEDFTRREWLELKNKDKKKKSHNSSGDRDTAINSLGPCTGSSGQTIGLCYEKSKTPYELRRYKFTFHCDCPDTWNWHEPDGVFDELYNGRERRGLYLRVEIDGYMTEIALSSYRWNIKVIQNQKRYCTFRARYHLRSLHYEHLNMYETCVSTMKKLMKGSDIVDTLTKNIDRNEYNNVRYHIGRTTITKVPYNNGRSVYIPRQSVFH
ncbi:hypothetical protein BDB01DRAFT_451952 [Pilobolus umbonatus]|nr:hypothetical protein BDB01DRAFT_451952 [Pilobolus umbonatus]